MISTCSNPVLIQDKIKGGHQLVDCNQCPACLAKRQRQLRAQLDAEAQSSASTLFITLTYDNGHVPHYVYSPETNQWVSSEHADLNIPQEEITYKLLCAKNREEFLLPTIQNFETYGSDYQSFATVSKRDIQLFLKRLRRLVEYDTENLLSEIPQKDRIIRYFIASEYGPKTYRPHYHGLLYFANNNVAEAVQKHYIYKAWQLCSYDNIKAEYVASNASSYVSKYVTKPANLPTILTISHKTALFSLRSSRPALGSQTRSYDVLSDQIQHNIIVDTKTRIADDGTPISYECAFPKHCTNFNFGRVYKHYNLNSDGILQYIRFAFRFIPRTELYKQFTDDYVTNYKLVTKHLPNHNSEVQRKVEHTDTLFVKYQLKNRPASIGDVYDNLSLEQRLFGIPQNRTFIHRAIITIIKNSLTIEDYVQTYQRYYYLRAQRFLKDQYEEYNENYTKEYSPIDRLGIAYPTYLLDLPNYLCLELQTYDGIKRNIRPILKSLRSFDVDVNEVYNPTILSGSKKDSVLTNYKAYQKTIEYTQSQEKVLKDASDFENIRIQNHHANQLQNNYEAF